MDTRFLESFLTVVDQGSIAEGARRLNLTSAAVAQRIRSLESEIGAKLLFRSGRTVRPTQAGAAILARARDFLGQVRDLKSIAANDVPSGELRIGAIQSAKAGLLPGILSVMARKYPQIEVHIVGDMPSPLYSKVLNGDLDAAIIVKPPFPIPKACDWRVLREEPLIVLTPASASVRDPHQALASEPFIRLHRNGWAGQLVDGYLRKARIRPRERFELDGLEAIAIMVDKGLGVSLVPDWSPPWPEGLALRKLPVPDDSFTRYIGLLWTRASLRARLVHAFLEVAAATLIPGLHSAPKRKRGTSMRRRQLAG
jgi:DNA-binding transcriptional LysR family regulator